MPRLPERLGKMVGEGEEVCVPRLPERLGKTVGEGEEVCMPRLPERLSKTVGWGGVPRPLVWEGEEVSRHLANDT